MKKALKIIGIVAALLLVLLLLCPLWLGPVAAMVANKVDLPDPVGPRMSVCPTSPAWRFNEKGVLPAVAA